MLAFSSIDPVTGTVRLERLTPSLGAEDKPAPPAGGCDEIKGTNLNEVL